MTVTLDQIEATHPPTFWPAAACRDLPPDWFHPDRGESLVEARTVCATCAVRPDCLLWAVTNNERFGVWGGTSERERRRIKRHLTQGEPVPELAPEWKPAGRPGRPIALATPPTPEVPEVDLTVATSNPATPNGSRPTDPDTGRPTDVCVNCGKRYTPNRSSQRFHSKECARAWYATHPRGEDTGVRQPRIRSEPPAKAPKPTTVKRHICETCGDPYQPARKDQRYCSPVCRQKSHNRKYYRPAAEAADSTAPPAETVPLPTPAAMPPALAAPIDVEALLCQVLAGSGRWHVEADLGDIHVTISRGPGR